MEALLPSSISPKISAILQSHVYPRVGRVLRTLARVKSLLLDALGGKKTAKRGARRRRCRRSTSSSRKKGNDLVSSGGFMTPHLAWSDGLSPPPARAAEEALDAGYHVYPSLESAWNAVVVPAPAGGREDGTAAEYCGYLRWLEEEMPDEVLVVEEEEDEEVVEVADGGNEIDMLAEKFIARCRARFLLEKQESDDRRCQEIIARGI